jgi:hypothetical protein
VNSRGHNKAMAQRRPTMMATLPTTIMKATIADRVLEAASMASSRAACTVARATKGAMTLPAHSRIMCRETTKRTRKCGECSVNDGLWTCLRSAHKEQYPCSPAACWCLRTVFFASVFGHSGRLGLTESVICVSYNFGD